MVANVQHRFFWHSDKSNPYTIQKKNRLPSKCACVSDPRHKGNPIYLDNLAALFQQTHSFWVTVDNMTERLKPDQILLALSHAQESQRAAVMNGLDSYRFILLHLSKPLIIQMVYKKEQKPSTDTVTLLPLSCVIIHIHLFPQYGVMSVRRSCVLSRCYQGMCRRQ